MSKALTHSNLSGRRTTRALAAISLSLSLIAFGCTTDRNLGNGDPVMTPGLRTSPTGNNSTGSETAPTLPQSMTSSSSIGSEQALPLVTIRNGMSRADQAALTMAQHQPRERYLGQSFPGYAGQPYASDGRLSGQFQNPAMRTNPQLTVNSSLTSGPTAVVSSGAGDAGVADASGIVAGTDAGVLFTGATTGTVATGTTTADTTAAAPVFNTGLAPSTLPTGTLAATATPTTSPTAFSVIAPSPLVSTSPALAEAASTTARTPVAGGTDINGTLIAGTNTVTNGTTATSATARVPAATVANPVRLTVDANGRRVMTNVGSRTPSRNQ